MKKIKLPLEMANGVLVRTIDELKENWDLEKVINYYLNGKLQTWLTDRYYIELADKVSALSDISDNTELQKKLCKVFGIELENNLVDMEAVAERNRRLEILRQYTADDAVLKNVDKVAFNQEELVVLLDEGETVIYLCDNKFSVPLSVTGKKYIGLGDVEIQVNSKNFVDFAKSGIELVNVHFNKEFENVLNSDTGLFMRGEDLETLKKYAEALELYKKAGEMGNSEGLFRTGKFYHEGRSGVEVNYELARQYYEKAVSLNNSKAINNLANLYANGRGVEKNIPKAIELYKKSAESGLSIAMCNLGNIQGVLNIDNGFYDRNSSINWYKKAIEFGNVDAIALLGKYYAYGHLLDGKKEAYKLYLKAASLGSSIAYDELGKVYEDAFGYGVNTDRNKSIEYYKKSIELGRANAAYHLGKLYYNICNYKEAIKYFQLVENMYNQESININNDIGSAVCYRGRMYEYGYWVDKNILKACEIYKEAYFKYSEGQGKIWAQFMYDDASEKDRKLISKEFGIIKNWNIGKKPYISIVSNV